MTSTSTTASLSKRPAAKPTVVIQHLLKAPNKDFVTKLCNLAILYRNVDPQRYPESAIADISSSLSITKGESRQTLNSLSCMLKNAVFAFASDPSSVGSQFPDDFHKSLKELLITIISKNFDEWKTSIFAESSSLPRLLDVNWRVEETHTDEISPPSECVLQIKMEQISGTDMPSEKTVNVRLNREKLNVMLDGLGKIRDQLEAATRK